MHINLADLFKQQPWAWDTQDVWYGSTVTDLFHRYDLQKKVSTKVMQPHLWQVNHDHLGDCS